ncbi:MAG: hypothetical protein CMA59_01410, partial [Euryarchaeota archaeon]|nr:hypothetical protein [Euryarchaeota archaeon]
DTPGFVDPDGFTCADWAGDWDGNGVPDCFASVDDVSYAAGYSPEELEALRAACPASCGVSCPAAPYIWSSEGTTPGRFFRADNLTRLKFVTKDATYECNGWIAETSLKEPVTEHLYNCSDVPDATNVYFGLTADPTLPETTPVPGSLPNETVPYPKVGHMDFPCQYGKDNGFCEDTVFAALCAHTCMDFQVAHLKAETQYYQTEAPCDPKDYNEAMLAFAQKHHPELLVQGVPPAGEECLFLAGSMSVWYNHTHSPCHYEVPGVTFPKVYIALCRYTCSYTDPPPPPAVVKSEHDEGDAVGASYPDRRLVGLTDMTVSYGGSDDGVVTVSYFCAFGCGPKC